MTANKGILIARVYDKTIKMSGVHLLIDRLWPRGIAKKDLNYDEWIKDIAPSTDLRKWFDHDPEKWTEFRKRYRAELETNQDAVNRCLKWAETKQLTLLYGAKDEEHNQAIVLREYLEEQISKMK